jgi:hypothetical protein
MYYLKKQWRKRWLWSCRDIGFNNNDTKEIHDVDKLASTCKKSIDYIAATTDLTPPIPEYVVRYYDT